MRRRGAPTPSPSAKSSPSLSLDDVLLSFASRAASVLEADDTQQSLLDITPSSGYLDRRQQRLLDFQGEVLRSCLSKDGMGSNIMQAEVAIRSAASGPDGPLRRALTEMDSALRRAYVRSVWTSSSAEWECRESRLEGNGELLDAAHDFLDLCISATNHLGGEIGTELDAAAEKCRAHYREGWEGAPPPGTEQALSIILHHRMARAIGEDPETFLPRFLKLVSGGTAGREEEGEEEVGQDLKCKMSALSVSMRSILDARATRASASLDDGISRVVSVVHREVGAPERHAPVHQTMDHRGEDKMKSGLAVAAAAREVEKVVLDSILGMKEEERTAELAVAREVHESFLREMAGIEDTVGKIRLMQGVGDSVRRRLMVHKVWGSYSGNK